MVVLHGTPVPRGRGRAAHLADQDRRLETVGRTDHCRESPGFASAIAMVPSLGPESRPELQHGRAAMGNRRAADRRLAVTALGG